MYIRELCANVVDMELLHYCYCHVKYSLHMQSLCYLKPKKVKDKTEIKKMTMMHVLIFSGSKLFFEWPKLKLH